MMIKQTQKLFSLFLFFNFFNFYRKEKKMFNYLGKKIVYFCTSTFYLIFYSHFLSTWGDRMQGFVLPLALSTLYPDTLLPTSLVLFLANIVCFALGVKMGQWVDKASRLRVVVVSIIMQNISVVIVCVCLMLLNSEYLFGPAEERKWSLNVFLDYKFTSIYAVLCIANSIAELYSISSSVAVERDWVVELSSHLCLNDSKIEIAEIGEEETKYVTHLDMNNRSVDQIDFEDDSFETEKDKMIINSNTKELVLEDSEESLMTQEDDDNDSLRFEKPKNNKEEKYRMNKSNEELLSWTNGWMQRIDLVSKTVAPLLVGFIVYFVHDNINIGVTIVGIWNIISGIPEVLLLVLLYYRHKDVLSKSQSDSNTLTPVDSEDLILNDSLLDSNEEDVLDQIEISEEDNNDILLSVEEDNNDKDTNEISKDNDKSSHPIFSMFSGWRLYTNQSVLFASLSYIALYFTILSPGGLMTAFLKSRGIEDYIQGLYLAFSAIIGLCATYAIPFIIKKLEEKLKKEKPNIDKEISLVGLICSWSQWSVLVIAVATFIGGILLDTNLLLYGVKKLEEKLKKEKPNIDKEISLVGLICSWSQWSVLVIAVATFIGGILLDTNLLLYGFLLCITMSRFPLWGFDLVERQIMQSNIKKEERGTVNSVETALTNFATLGISLLSVIISDPDQFWILVILSNIGVLFASLLFSLYFFKSYVLKK
eukprot:TRINITY_DN2483_c0_g1_i1.p1 TRINITY_DN2483_c0_g1~~TRINITY_DN2483_c0_g1_i1.p1  ORF type:complete len:706 (+),score=195.04 TRINITY_DN2483_c0_g1_i1:29-2146(+)